MIAKLTNQVHVIANGTASNENVMYLYGDDFSWSNAYALYDNLEKIIKYGNLYNKHNITFVMSTPSRYVDALMAENVTWPVFYDDLPVYVQYNFDAIKEKRPDNK